MNHIKRLQQDNAEQLKQMADVCNELNEFISFLSSSKFQGTCPQDGSNNDWIRTGEVQDMLVKIKNMMLSN